MSIGAISIAEGEWVNDPPADTVHFLLSFTPRPILNPHAHLS